MLTPARKAVILSFRWEMEKDMNLLLRNDCPVLMGFVMDLILGDPRGALSSGADDRIADYNIRKIIRNAPAEI